MSAPQRIQRERTKGWRMPEGAVYVGRPSGWGNPFTVGGVFRFETLNGTFVGVVKHKAHAYEMFREYVLYSDSENGRARRDMIRSDLAGRDLACWCPLDHACHADVLLVLANGADS